VVLFYLNMLQRTYNEIQKPDFSHLTGFGFTQKVDFSKTRIRDMCHTKPIYINHSLAN
jgi:hypothetical protein